MLLSIIKYIFRYNYILKRSFKRICKEKRYKDVYNIKNYLLNTI